MTWALRWSVVGAAIATALHLVYDPPIGVVMGAFMCGWGFGVLTFLVDEVFERISK